MDKTQKRKKYVVGQHNNYKKRKQLILEPGMTGFLCTCNFHEKGCVTDAYKLLNLFADEKLDANKESEISSTTNTLVKKETNESSENTDENEDISTALEKEINELRTEHEMPLSSRKFQAVDTGAKNLIFIASTLPNPLELVTKILTKLDATKEQCTRYLLRLLPIELICKAYMDDIRTKANTLLKKYFTQEPKTFSIVVNRRNNNSINKYEIIKDLAGIITKNRAHKADLTNPEIAVVVEVVRGVCLFSIAPNYYKFKKYNLFEICNSTKNKVISNKEAAESIDVKTESIDVKTESIDTKSEKDLDTVTSSAQEAEESDDKNLDTEIGEKEQIKLET